MDKPQSLRRFLLEAGAILLFVLLAYAAFELLKPNTPPAAPAVLPSSPEESSSPAQIEASGTPYPYPPPGSQAGSSPPPPILPDIVQDLYSKSSLYAGYKAAVLAHGQVWLVQSDHQPAPLVDFGDVAVIFGWNYDGTKLLFGRGQYDTSGDLAKTTELWIYDLNTEKSYRLMDNPRIWSAIWSPVDNRIAYCEYGEIPTLTIISPDGKILQKRDEYFFSDLAWSPDGSGIAVSYSGPDMVDHDTRFSVLAIWWLEKDEVQVLSNAKREAHYFPIWLSDGSHILFTRIFGPGSAGGESGLFIADIQTRLIVQLQNGPKYIVNRIMRSPRSDRVVFWMGDEVYAMELGHEPIFIGKGSQPIWHPDGKTVFYIGENGLYQIKSLDFWAGNQVIGGFFSASTIHLQPSIFLK